MFPDVSATSGNRRNRLCVWLGSMRRSQRQAGTADRPALSRRRNIFALGSGAWDDMATERCVACDSSCEDGLDSLSDLPFLADAAERASHEDSRRHAAMCRRRREEAAAAEEVRANSEVALEPPTEPVGALRASRQARALSYCAGDDAKLDAYIQHLKAEVRALLPALLQRRFFTHICRKLILYRVRFNRNRATHPLSGMRV